jgi:hypothetical protein
VLKGEERQRPVRVRLFAGGVHCPYGSVTHHMSEHNIPTTFTLTWAAPLSSLIPLGRAFLFSRLPLLAAFSARNFQYNPASRLSLLFTSSRFYTSVRNSQLLTDIKYFFPKRLHPLVPPSHHVWVPGLIQRPTCVAQPISITRTSTVSSNASCQRNCSQRTCSRCTRKSSPVLSPRTCVVRPSSISHNSRGP